MTNELKKIVVMGGGTGTYPVITGLKKAHVKLSSVIAVSDSGGSTGRIRDEFGFQPVGDLRQALAALAESENEEWVRKILLYRFTKGEGLKGHNLGNLLLTALQDMTGETTKALEIVERVFGLQGEVLPTTQDNVQLQIRYENGEVVVGEHILDEVLKEPKKIQSVELIPQAQITPAARRAIVDADMIVIGPGDYYASLFAALLPKGMEKALKETKGKVVYMVNLMTRLTQTHEMTASQHVTGIEALIGRPVDVVVMNSQVIPDPVLKAYAESQEFPVQDDMGDDVRVHRADLLSDALAQKLSVDTAYRSLLRHDQNKVRQVLLDVLNEAQ